MKGRPETDRENPQYIADMVEVLAYLTDEEIAVLTHPRTGLQTVCKFLPTPADVYEFLRQHRAKAEHFAPAPTIYRKLTDETGPWDQETDFERKRRVVRQWLGYNPDGRNGSVARDLTPPSAEDLANLRLKTPAAPPSPQLIAKLEADGWPFIPQGDKA